MASRLDVKHRSHVWYQESFSARLSAQQRQHGLTMAGLSRDLAAAAATLETMAPGADREQVAELLGGVETKMGELVTASTQYGKLKVASLDTIVTPVDMILAAVRGDSVPEAGPAADVR